MAKENTEKGFFNKNFNIINFLVQGGILITILSFVFKFGIYYEQMNYILKQISDVAITVDVIKDKVLENEKKIQNIEKGYILLDKSSEDSNKKIRDIERCQANRKYCK